MKTNSLYQPGRNCWRLEKSPRVAFFIDGADYFRAFHEVVAHTEQQFLIASWDLDSSIKLIRNQSESVDYEGHAYPVKLGDFLNTALERQEKLEGFILNWDYPILLQGAREMFGSVKFKLGTNKNLHYAKDSTAPPLACHHQKIVVADDQLAFCGGLDLTRNRWDTPLHDANDSRRIDIGSEVPKPHHDVQIAVSGDAAFALGQLVRDRWANSEGNRISAVFENGASLESLWPSYKSTFIENVTVAISRTMPLINEENPIREVEQLYLDSIHAAERYIFIENQYLTAERIVKALAKRLSDTAGPDIVIILPYAADGWVTQNTLDITRQKAISDLKEQDQFQRLAAYYPRLEKQNNSTLNVHSKTMIIDDEFVRIGSSNICNRSMNTDSECDISLFEPNRADVKNAIADFRDTLLAEHLGVSKQLVTETIETTSFKSAVEKIAESRANQSRTLAPIEQAFSEDAEPIPGEDLIFDPKERKASKRLEINKAVEKPAFSNFYAASKERVETLLGRLPKPKTVPWTLIVIGITIISITLLWKHVSIESVLNHQSLTTIMEETQSMPFSGLIFGIAVFVASSAMVPITLLAVLISLTFGLYKGLFIMLPACVLSAAAAFLLGARLKVLPGTRINAKSIEKINTILSRQGILSTIAIRFLPLGPFTMVNMIAGASKVRLRDFIIGTTLGLLPGLSLIMLAADKIREGLLLHELQQSFTTLLLIGFGIAVIFICREFFKNKFLDTSYEEDSDNK